MTLEWQVLVLAFLATLLRVVVEVAYTHRKGMSGGNYLVPQEAAVSTSTARSTGDEKFGFD
jgi:hypothetical protein